MTRNRRPHTCTKEWNPHIPSQTNHSGGPASGGDEEEDGEDGIDELGIEDDEDGSDDEVKDERSTDGLSQNFTP